MMKWLFKKELVNLSLLTEFEKQYNVTFPQYFKDFLIENHASRPDPYIIDAEKTIEIPVKALLSFNKEDKPEDIWSSYSAIQDRLPNNMIPFMSDEGGNYICIDLDPLSDAEEILYWTHENNQLQKITTTLEEFQQKFYDF